jgi:hypothetical protein
MTWVSDTLAGWSAWYGGTVDPATATRALTLALQSVETWLDRPLERLERTETAEAACAILLRAWPVASVASVTAGQAATVIPPEQYRLDARRGILTPGGYYWSTTVTYTGGLPTPFPADLEMALWTIAAELYPGMGSAAEAGTGQGVKRVTTPDVGTVEFASSGSSGEGRTADRLLGGILSPAIEATLQRYRAESAVGVG